MLQRACACGKHTTGGECESCKQKRATLQRFAVRNPEAGTVPDIVYDVLRSPGQPLDTDTHSFMESRLGYDFSGVRVHTDQRAMDSAVAVDARAYTVGRDIAFGAGQYAPQTSVGRQLLAHELTHVIQQGDTQAVGGSLQVGSTDTPAELEAHNNADHIHVPTRSLSASRSSGLSIQRAAPAAAVGIGALAAKCVIGAIVGVLFELAIQTGMHVWRRGRMTLEGLRVDYCSLVLTAILGCIGGAAAARWLEPWINSQLGARLGGVAGTLIGRILLFIANKLAIGVPRAMVKQLLKLGCISEEQGEALAPGVARELLAEAGDGSGASEEAA